MPTAAAVGGELGTAATVLGLDWAAAQKCGAEIDDFCAWRAHGVAGSRAPSSATPRGEARNAVPDEC